MIGDVVSKVRNGYRDGAIITFSVVPREGARNLRRPSAFTLVEMLLVLAIMSMVAGIAVPRYTDFTVRQRLDAAVRRFTSDMALAQRRARFTGTSQKVSFSVGSSTYVFLNSPDPFGDASMYSVALREEPYGVFLISAEFAGNSTITFDGHGAPDAGGTVVLQAGYYQKTLTVDGQTGQISTSGVVRVVSFPSEL